MRLLYLDIDTLRPDHLSCYGYPRRTSPNLDSLATRGVRFDQVYASDSPCLPSRSALMSGRFGVHNGVVNHGGQRSEPFPAGPERRRRSDLAATSWPSLLRQTGAWCATISTFAERHSAFHWYAGFNEVLNLGTDGKETADQVSGAAIEWLRRNRGREDWFLHVHFWDPHTPYRTPASYGNPFEGEPVPDWIDDDVLRRHWHLAGPHSAQEVMGFGLDGDRPPLPRQPEQVRHRDDLRRLFDGYDVGIHYADHHIGQVLAALEELGIGDETAVVVSSDHGENLGEMGIYGDHQTADQYTHRLPLIVKWPGADGGRVDRGLRYHLDMAATAVDLAGGTVPEDWDGVSFARLLGGGPDPGRDHLILSCAAWAVQRSVRFDRWLCIRTYHDAFHDFPDVMLYDLERDPHEQHDVAAARPDIVDRAASLLLDWDASNMARSPSGVDPFWTVMAEGGGYYVRDRLEPYLRRLSDTGREAAARRIEATHSRYG